MGIRERIVMVLEQEKGRPVSGERLAADLGVSRAAVWKAVKELREGGFDISAVPRQGYTLSARSDVMTLAGLSSYMGKDAVSLLEYYGEIGSTNQRAKQWAVEGAPHGSAVVAARQTQGQGRRGRNFLSPDGGVYLSIVLRPSSMPSSAEPVLITTAAAVAVAQTIEEVCGPEHKMSIKWVNDLFFGKKKVCGILTEGITDMESGTISALVVGIGVNFSTPPTAFPPELQVIAGSLYDSSSHVPTGINRSLLAARIIAAVIDIAAHLGEEWIWQYYRSRSILLGRAVTVESSSGPYSARVEDIDRSFHLHVERADGSRQELSAGEVSIRFQ